MVFQIHHISRPAPFQSGSACPSFLALVLPAFPLSSPDAQPLKVPQDPEILQEGPDPFLPQAEQEPEAGQDPETPQEGQDPEEQQDDPFLLPRKAAAAIPATERRIRISKMFMLLSSFRRCF